MNLNLQRKDKEKTIALQVSDESYKDILQISEEVNKSDLKEDLISLITKKFGYYLKRMCDKKKTEQTPKFPIVSTPDKPQRSINFRGHFHPRIESKIQVKLKKLDSIQCHECSEFGHYANECANRLRKNKGYNVILSDDESEEDRESNAEENHTSLTVLLVGKCNLQVNPQGVA